MDLSTTASIVQINTSDNHSGAKRELWECSRVSDDKGNTVEIWIEKEEEETEERRGHPQETVKTDEKRGKRKRKNEESDEAGPSNQVVIVHRRTSPRSPRSRQPPKRLHPTPYGKNHNVSRERREVYPEDIKDNEEGNQNKQRKTRQREKLPCPICKGRRHRVLSMLERAKGELKKCPYLTRLVKGEGTSPAAVLRALKNLPESIRPCKCNFGCFETKDFHNFMEWPCGHMMCITCALSWGKAREEADVESSE